MDWRPKGDMRGTEVSAVGAQRNRGVRHEAASSPGGVINLNLSAQL